MSRPLRFLSWNLAMLERSNEAPPGWEQYNTEAAVRDVVLAVEPDIICYQELPRLVPFVETHGLLPATPESHSGNIAVLVTHQLLATEPETRIVAGCAVLATFDSGLTIANVHLESGRNGEARRLEQMASVVEASPTPHLLIVGDTNMRVSEAAAMDDAGFPGDRPPAATWDSRRNRFRDGGHEFTAYFTRWFAASTVEVSDVTVHREPVDVDGRTFHVSDHYALSGTVEMI